MCDFFIIFCFVMKSNVMCFGFIKSISLGGSTPLSMEGYKLTLYTSRDGTVCFVGNYAVTESLLCSGSINGTFRPSSDTIVSYS